MVFLQIFQKYLENPSTTISENLLVRLIDFQFEQIFLNQELVTLNHQKKAAISNKNPIIW